MSKQAIRRTKIIATLGPASESPEVLEKIIRAGTDVVRLNFSHGTADEHRARAELVRGIAGRLNRHVAILADLQGPKIRIACFKEKRKIQLVEGQDFDLDIALPDDAGDETQVGCHYDDLPRDVKSGDILLLNDGLIEMKVKEVVGTRVKCIVTIPGVLSDHKGINKKGGGLSAPALTDKDREDLLTAVSIGADYLAISFPRSKEDILEARELLRQAGSDMGIVAKIERAEAILDGVIEGIIDASDVIMVARGDLGVEIGDAQLPHEQKRLIRLARMHNKVVITATQMMESMIENPQPTRAEVSDVANAVIDGTDAVMLSAETAAGKFPDRAVDAMARVCIEAEKYPRMRQKDHRMSEEFEKIDEAIAMSAMYIANRLDVRAIGALTETGSTPLWMSRISSGIPIFALTNHDKTCRKVTLYRGVYPIFFDEKGISDHAVLNRAIVEEFQWRKLVNLEDMVILTKGDLTGRTGGTNALKIARVSDVLAAAPVSPKEE
ncbi:MAG: pyruvate kinase [Candidatus Methylumidiphilus alinenensis]|uniref:Pyruvate kinase n=1 Tax=Candidatus Methylumidiphilus alinenensis TaxID=2202197 RepID=A0A2W4ST74_9GAMM|nr:MAG: pyruvate kinase [Candidatus Methylumidiphilus alinenensis]